VAIRESILNNIVTTLKTISVVNGYNNDVGLVTRESFNWNNLLPKDFPAALVVWKRETKDATGMQGQHILADMVVVIRGVVNAPKYELETALNKFLNDIETAICVDTTRGGLCEYTDPLAITVFQTELIDFALFDFEFTVEYQYLYGSP